MNARVKRVINIFIIVAVLAASSFLLASCRYQHPTITFYDEDWNIVMPARPAHRHHELLPYQWSNGWFIRHRHNGEAPPIYNAIVRYKGEEIARLDNSLENALENELEIGLIRVSIIGTVGENIGVNESPPCKVGYYVVTYEMIYNSRRGRNNSEEKRVSISYTLAIEEGDLHQIQLFMDDEEFDGREITVSLNEAHKLLSATAFIDGVEAAIFLADWVSIGNWTPAHLRQDYFLAMQPNNHVLNYYLDVSIEFFRGWGSPSTVDGFSQRGEYRVTYRLFSYRLDEDGNMAQRANTGYLKTLTIFVV
jgi:hypothetical protein